MTNHFRPEINDDYLLQFIREGQEADIFGLCADCKDIMDELSGYHSPDDWVKYTFQYLLSVYYPDNYQAEAVIERREAVRYFLDRLNRLFLLEKRTASFDRCRDFDLLRNEEQTFCDIPEEYDRFLDCFWQEYTYAFLRLSRICTPYDTLGHIAGVHHVAMYMARQIIQTGLDVDLGLMSGTAMIHDIGKFGCRPEEGRRVPYLHYYYTYQFCKKYQLNAIGDIASNHSVWDLELSNLSIESLLLIYADFRVKSIRENGKEKVCFWSLKESYQIILNMLDQVDDAKRQRYARVYSRLRDFEEYLVSLGCCTDLEGGLGEPEKQTPPAIMLIDEVIRLYKHKAIRSNLRVMHDTSHEADFYRMLEDIRSEKDWRHVRSYLSVIDSYSAYLGQEQKEIILQFLYEMLSHQDDDVRMQAGRVAGHLIAASEIRFTKEIPEGYHMPEVGKSLTEIWEQFLVKILVPEPGLQNRYKKRIGIALKDVIEALLSVCDSRNAARVIQVVISQIEIYMQQDKLSKGTLFYLINGVSGIPADLCKEGQKDALFRFAKQMLISGEEPLAAAAILMLSEWQKQDGTIRKRVSSEVISLKRPENKVSESVINRYHFLITGKTDGLQKPPAANLYLQNQRNDTLWTYKLLNLELLKQRYLRTEMVPELYQYASHLLNILQFNEYSQIKRKAGEDLTEVSMRLTPEQRYEIVLELVRTLELGDFSVSKYVPAYLGRIFSALSFSEQEEILERFYQYVNSSSEKIAVVTLETAGVIMHHLPHRKMADAGHSAIYEKQAQSVQGLLFLGLVHYEPDVRQEAFSIIGQAVFTDKTLPVSEKCAYYVTISCKVLNLLRKEDSELSVYSNAAAWNQIYNFLTDALMAGSRIEQKQPERVAFFPGTFDPFSLGHKEIVKEILRQDFNVYLALDEFSWSKQTQPYGIRREIMALSTADLPDVYLFPDEIPVNISNPADLSRLLGCFPDSEVFIVAGQDVIDHCSAYAKPEESCSIHQFPHILFDRISGNKDRQNRSNKIKGKIIRLNLPIDYESISSTQVRDNVERNKDISGLVEQNVQNYIYAQNLYAIEAPDKKDAEAVSLETVFLDDADENIWRQIPGSGRMPISDRHSERMVYLRESDGDRSVQAAVLWHMIGMSDLYDECGSFSLTEKMREITGGQMAVITGLAGVQGMHFDMRMTVLNELMAHCQANSVTYALCFGSVAYDDILRRQGFIRPLENESVYLLDLRIPLVLYYDTTAYVKEPFSGDPVVKKSLWQSHLRLLDSLTLLYPGSLILSLESKVLNDKLTKLILKDNVIPEKQYTEKILAEDMCVPFGKLFKGALVPGCVTKGLDLEKQYQPDGTAFQIRELPNHASLTVQIRMLKSFGRDVILTDDLFHKGKRMLELDPYFEQEEIPVKKLVVGVLSGRGYDLAKEEKRIVEAAYYVPIMRAWLMESDLYPFIGGDGIDVSERKPVSGSLPSVNMILPYMMPPFLKGTSMNAVYALSECCLKNAKEIYRALEKRYQKSCGKRLSVERRGEVLRELRHPDGVTMSDTEKQARVSELIDREMAWLTRLKAICR